MRSERPELRSQPWDGICRPRRKQGAIIEIGRSAIDRLAAGAAVVLHIERRGELLYLALTVE